MPKKTVHKAVGLRTYVNGTKRTWRGTIWNAIDRKLVEVERINVHLGQVSRRRQDLTVVTLAGPEDADRRAAINRRFSNKNIVSVDVDDDIARHLRRKRRPAVSALLSDFLMTYRNGPVDVLVADLCCGVAQTAIDLAQAILMSECIGMTCVIAVNLLRGRDHGPRIANGLGLPDKHRGRLFIAILAKMIVSSMPSASREQRLLLLESLVDSAEFFSYKSGPQVFDSVVFEWPLSPMDHAVTDRWKEYRLGKREAGRKVSFDVAHMASKQAFLTRFRQGL